jgi:hypothetical protein
MTSELDVLGVVSDRLSASSVPFMLTRSFALAYIDADAARTAVRT